MRALGAACGVPTPMIDAVIELVHGLTGKDFAADARTLQRMGLAGQDTTGIRRVMEEGFG
jgi:hypothetical protein